MKKSDIIFREEGAAIKVKGFYFPSAKEIADKLCVPEHIVQPALEKTWEELAETFWIDAAPAIVEEVFGPYMEWTDSGRSNGWLCINLHNKDVYARKQGMAFNEVPKFARVKKKIEQWIKDHSTIDYVAKYMVDNERVELTPFNRVMYGFECMLDVSAKSPHKTNIESMILDAKLLTHSIDRLVPK